jgi:hypothetical protein
MRRSPKDLCLVGAVVLGIAWGWLRLRADEPSRPSAPRHAAAGVDVLGEARVAERSRVNQPRTPHPITSAHEAMAQRRELISALVRALEDQNHERAQQLLSEAEKVEGAHSQASTFGATVLGYHLILDCLRARDASPNGPLPSELVDASRGYLDQHRLPPRRQVRRVCLEGRPFARRA